MTFLAVLALVMSVFYAASRALRVVAWYNWRWEIESWRTLGALSADGSGVVARAATGHYLIGRARGGWGAVGEATVFRDERRARKIIGRMRLTTPIEYERVEARR